MLRSIWVHYAASAWLIAGIALSGVLSYLAVAISARVLGPADFGLLGTLLAVSAFAANVVRPGGFAVTHLTVAAFGRSRDVGVTSLLALGLVTGLAVSLIVLPLLVVVAVPLSSVVGSDFRLLVLLAALIGATACLHVTNGVIVGVQRFSLLAASSVADAAARAIATTPLVVLFGVPGSLFAYVAGQMAAIALTITRMGGLSWQLPPFSDVVEGLKTGGSALSLVSGIALLQNADLVLLRSYRQADESGLYAACASLGNLLVTLSSAFYLPAFPRALKAFREGGTTLAILTRVLAPLTAAGAAAYFVALMAGGPIIALLFGAAFAPAASILPTYLAKTTVLVLVGVLGQHALATGRGHIVHLVIPAALGGLGVMAVTRPDPIGTAIIGFVASLVALTTYGLSLLIATRVHPRDSA